MKITKLIISLVIILGLLQLVVSHNMANNGEKLSQMELEIKQLESDNKNLTEVVYKAGSLKEISLKAQDLGFIKTSKVLNLSPEIPVAYNY